MHQYKHFFYDKFIDLGISANLSEYLNMAVLLIALIIIVFISDFITRKILVEAFNRFASRTKNKLDDLLVAYKVPRNIAHIVPLLITLELFPIVFSDFLQFETAIEKILKVYGVLIIIWIIKSFLQSVEAHLKTRPRLKDKPIDSYVQVVMLFVWIVGIAGCFAIVGNITFQYFFTTLGAASAVLLLIFKDTILGFVASIQVSVNDTIRIGDWVTMEKYGADGDVIEINLSTVQVQNFDKTITYIPTYALLSDSFKNWRGMNQSGGRRIKRSIILKASSVHYLTREEVDKLKGVQLIHDYLDHRQTDIDKYNSENNIDKSMLINGRNMTNLGVFRKYLQTYIQNHSAINKDMTIMIRQMTPTSEGIPLEIYAFSSDKRWENYEYIIADVFDHGLAAVPYFKLEVFELGYPKTRELPV